jgi:hypothetical protein
MCSDFDAFKHCGFVNVDEPSTNLREHFTTLVKFVHTARGTTATACVVLLG